MPCNRKRVERYWCASDRCQLFKSISLNMLMKLKNGLETSSTKQTSSTWFWHNEVCRCLWFHELSDGDHQRPCHWFRGERHTYERVSIGFTTIKHLKKPSQKESVSESSLSLSLVESLCSVCSSARANLLLQRVATLHVFLARSRGLLSDGPEVNDWWSHRAFTEPGFVRGTTSRWTVRSGLPLKLDASTMRQHTSWQIQCVEHVGWYEVSEVMCLKKRTIARGVSSHCVNWWQDIANAISKKRCQTSHPQSRIQRFSFCLCTAVRAWCLFVAHRRTRMSNHQICTRHHLMCDVDMLKVSCEMSVLECERLVFRTSAILPMISQWLNGCVVNRPGVGEVDEHNTREK